MDRAEQNVTTAANLYEARRAAKFLLGASYTATLKPYREFIARVMADEQLGSVSFRLSVLRSCGCAVNPISGAEP